MLDAEVDALLEVAVADDLVDDDANRRRGHVVHDAGAAVVVLVGHALLLRRVGLDVDNVTDAVDLEERRQGDRALGLEVALEHVARARAETERVRHGERLDGLRTDKWSGVSGAIRVPRFASSGLLFAVACRTRTAAARAARAGDALLPGPVAVQLAARAVAQASLDDAALAHHTKCQHVQCTQSTVQSRAGGPRHMRADPSRAPATQHPAPSRPPLLQPSRVRRKCANRAAVLPADPRQHLRVAPSDVRCAEQGGRSLPGRGPRASGAAGRGRVGMGRARVCAGMGCARGGTECGVAGGRQAGEKWEGGEVR